MHVALRLEDGTRSQLALWLYLLSKIRTKVFSHVAVRETHGMKSRDETTHAAHLVTMISKVSLKVVCHRANMKHITTLIR